MRDVGGHPFECTQCGKCCRWEGKVYLKNSDINRLSNVLGLPQDEFLKRFTENDGVAYVLKNKENNTDCCLMEGNKCSIYNAKPEQCDLYPQKYDPECPGFHNRKEGGMSSKFEEVVKKMNQKFSGFQEYDKKVANNLYSELGKGVKSSDVASKAIDAGLDAFLEEKIKVASLDDLFAFNRVDEKHLIHKSTRDLWSIEADDDGNVQVARMFDNGEPIKG